MKINKKIRNQFRIQNSIFVILLIILTITIGYLSNEIDYQWDVTSNKRHSLSDATRDFVSELKGPINITAFVSKADIEGSLKPTIHNFLSPYRRAKSDISVTYIDPREAPQKAEEAGIRFDGELVIEYKGRKENLNTLTEQDLTNLLVRLSRATDKIIFSLKGHKERTFEGNSPRDMGLLGQQLMKTGFELAKVDLAEELSVGDNASLLVVASPKANLLPGEVNRIKRFLETGGNLLWLLEHGSNNGMDKLADYIGTDLNDGLVFDPRAASLNLSPAFALASKYLEHPATQGSSMTSVFPFTRSVGKNEKSDFVYTPLVEVADQGWLETGNLSDATFNPNRDLAGPIVVAAAFERLLENKTQRIIIVGTGNIFSNQHLGLLGNLDFGVNIVNWLTGDESLIRIQPRARLDQTLEFNLGVFLLANTFLFLPGVFLITGAIVWWRRRRA